MIYVVFAICVVVYTSDSSEHGLQRVLEITLMRLQIAHA